MLPRLYVLSSLSLLFACSGPAPFEEESVKPGINESFVGAEADVASIKNRLEGESREIFVHRARIAGAMGIEAGMHVADIGAGTGIFMSYFAKGVGSEGKVYAVDLSEQLVEQLAIQASESDYSQVEVVQCEDRDVCLPEGSVDMAFICDTYHHFEYPRNTMATIHRAMRPGGHLVVVDFERIPGVTREWLLDHVRAGKEVFRSEIEAAGFEFVEERPIRGLSENYFLRFVRK